MKQGSLVIPTFDYKEHIALCTFKGIIPNPQTICVVEKMFSDRILIEESRVYINSVEQAYDIRYWVEIQEDTSTEALLEEIEEFNLVKI